MKEKTLSQLDASDPLKSFVVGDDKNVGKLWDLKMELSQKQGEIARLICIEGKFDEAELTILDTFKFLINVGDEINSIKQNNPSKFASDFIANLLENINEARKSLLENKHYIQERKHSSTFFSHHADSSSSEASGRIHNVQFNL